MGYRAGSGIRAILFEWSSIALLTVPSVAGRGEAGRGDEAVIDEWLNSQRGRS